MTTKRQMEKTYRIEVQGTWEQVAQAFRAAREELFENLRRGEQTPYTDSSERIDQLKEDCLTPNIEESMRDYKRRIRNLIPRKSMSGLGLYLSSLTTGRLASFTLSVATNEDNALSFNCIIKKGGFTLRIDTCGDYNICGEGAYSSLRNRFHQSGVEHRGRCFESLNVFY